MLDNTLKANDVRNLAYLRELVNKLHLDEEFEGHNYELLDDIEYIIACQIMQASKHLTSYDEYTRKEIIEASLEVRRQNYCKIPAVDEVLPIVGDIVELLTEHCSSIMQDHIRQEQDLSSDQPIVEVVKDVDYYKGTVTTEHGYVFKIDHVKIIQYGG